MKKQSLLNFIEWKMSNDGESEKEHEEILKMCKKMSYKELHQYAVVNDFIDY